jgi:hypothetical protein
VGERIFLYEKKYSFDKDYSDDGRCGERDRTLNKRVKVLYRIE